MRRYAPIILYEGLLRFAAAALLVPAGLMFGYGPLVAAVGAIDVVWGLTYFLIVPHQTGKPITQLLLGDAAKQIKGVRPEWHLNFSKSLHHKAL